MRSFEMLALIMDEHSLHKNEHQFDKIDAKAIMLKKMQMTFLSMTLLVMQRKVQ